MKSIGLLIISIFVFIDALPRMERESIGTNFDYLMMTRIYPAAVCLADDDAVPDSCEIPSGTPKWTIHGLWPNYSNGSYPQFCPGNPQRFDIDQIHPIMDQLTKVWPNLYPKKSIASFWKHEWEKHGTCAESDSKMASEYLYFLSTIQLNEKHSVEAALQAAGIQPSATPYKKEVVAKALSSFLANNKTIQFNCLTDKKTHQSLLADVRMCFDKEFQIIDCPKSRKVSTSNGGAHLPSFQSCPDLITFLMPTDSSTLQTEYHPIAGSNIVFFVNPLINLYPHLVFKHKSVSIMALVICMILLFVMRRHMKTSPRN